MVPIKELSTTIIDYVSQSQSTVPTRTKVTKAILFTDLFEIVRILNCNHLCFMKCISLCLKVNYELCKWAGFLDIT